MLHPRTALAHTGFFFVIETIKKFLWIPWNKLSLPIETYIADSDTNAQTCQFLEHEPVKCQSSD